VRLTASAFGSEVVGSRRYAEPLARRIRGVTLVSSKVEATFDSGISEFTERPGVAQGRTLLLERQQKIGDRPVPMPTLLGRESALATIESLLPSVDSGGGALVVRGEPGIGKSALLEWAAERAEELGITVLRTAGAPSETQMAFAGLHRLLRPYLSGLDDLPAPQRDALSLAFGLHVQPELGAPPDIFLIALATLDLVADAAASSPLVLLVEDAHWLDAATADVLAFVARRIEVEPLAVLFTLREGSESPLEAAQLPELRLHGLDERYAAQLLDQIAPELPRETRGRVLETASGNPLALVELSHATSTNGFDAYAGLGPLPVTQRLERAFSERLPALPEATRLLLLVAALDEGGGLAEHLEAASSLAATPVTTRALAPAEAAGLVSLEDSTVRFRHPLVRAAVAGSAITTVRQAAHAALADAHATEVDRSVWHRAASCSGPDDEVAGELEAAAGRALSRGATAVAAAALQRAALLTESPGRRGSLLVRAAEMEFELGRYERALRVTEQARALELDVDDRARLMFMLESVDEVSWSGAERVASFAAIANEMTRAHEPERALKALQAAALRCWWGNPSQETRDLVVAAAERIPVAEDHPSLLAVLSFADPVRRGAVVLERLEHIVPNASDDPEAMHLLGTAATAVFAFDRSATFLDWSVEGLRRQGRLGLLAQALVSQSWAAVHLALPTLAKSAGEEAARLAPETGQQRWGLAANLALAMIAGERGDLAGAEAIAAEAEAVLLPMGTQPMLALVQFVRGRGAVAHHMYDEGFAYLRRVLDPHDVAYHPFVGAWALPDLIEAAVHTGARHEAERYLNELESLASSTGASYLRAAEGYARAIVADEEVFFDAALGSNVRDWPCFHGRLLLNYGRWLRRNRRIAESRAPLRAARQSFDALGFDGLAETARQELRASGESSIRRTPDARDQLTAQELQIAELAAAGLSNREIGQKLYVSHRTVESHLYRIFPKLGVSSRAQLRLALPEAAGRA
jgi:DNA-binding CsgD family transcriptional regulator